MPAYNASKTLAITIEEVFRSRIVDLEFSDEDFHFVKSLTLLTDSVIKINVKLDE